MKIPKHENCKNCGECCGVILATEKEIEKIRKYVSKMNPEYREEVKNQKRDKLG